MRWENDIDYLPEASAQSWSKRSDGNFGGMPILELNVYGRNPIRQDISAENESLSHFGIPGMHWGVTTKEYIKKGYNTLARRQAILKRQRQAKAKEEQRRNFEEGYRRGQKKASNTYYVKNRVQEILDRKKLQEEGTLSDRLVRKGFKKTLKNKSFNKAVDKINESTQEYGIDAKKLIRENGEAFLLTAKNIAVDTVINGMRSEKGQARLQNVATFITTGKRPTKNREPNHNTSISRIENNTNDYKQFRTRSSTESLQKRVGLALDRGLDKALEKIMDPEIIKMFLNLRPKRRG